MIFSASFVGCVSEDSKQQAEQTQIQQVQQA